MASSSAAASATDKLNCSRANLFYKTDEKQAWTRLDGTDNKDFNIFTVVVRQTISFQQRYKGGAGSCSLTIEPGQYSDPKIDAVKNDEGDNEIRLSLHVTDLSTPKLSGTVKTLADFPLSSLVSNLNTLELRLPVDEITPKLRPDILRERLVTLTTGRVSTTPGTDEHEYLQTVMRGQLGEEAGQADLLKTQTGCRLKTYMMGRKVFVNVWPNALPDRPEVDMDKRNMSMRYLIKNSTIFLNDKVKEHKVFHGETLGWVLTNHGSRDDVPIVGVIENYFSSTTIKSFTDREEEDVTLEPIFDDIGGSRGRAALKDVEQNFNDRAAEIVGHLKKDSKTSRLNLRAVFLPGCKFSDGDNELPQYVMPVPNEWRARLNDSQCCAIEMATKTRVSVVHGPAATGKTITLAHVLCQLHGPLYPQTVEQKTIVTAPTNVAVDNIRRKCGEVWDLIIKGSKGFVRLYSETEIESQFVRQQQAVYNDPMHLDQLRFEIAQAAPQLWDKYLTGRKQLIEYFGFNNPAEDKAYCKQRNELTQLVMSRARVVFCTMTSLRTPALFRIDKDNKAIAWGATTVIIDEAGCCNPLQVMLATISFQSLERLILAGDWLQLPAFILNPETKKLWPKSFLKDLHKKVPTTLLNVQYRMHNRLYAAANHCVYEDRVSSAYKTEHPKPFLQFLLAHLPSFTLGGRQYRLRSYLQFIDVFDGVARSIEQGSSCNDKEVDCVELLVEDLLAKGVPATSIAVMTGYLWQLTNLKARFRSRGWPEVRILTVDTSQGDEFDIVIISLVKTGGSHGFMSQPERANVAVTRPKEAIYFVGNWVFWRQRPKNSGYVMMHSLLQNMWHNYDGPKAEFVVKGFRTNASPPAAPSPSVITTQSRLLNARAPEFKPTKSSTLSTLQQKKAELELAQKEWAEMKEYSRQNDIASRASHRDVIDTETTDQIEHVKACAKIVEDEIRAKAEGEINELKADADAKVATILAKKQERMEHWEQEADMEARANAAAFDEQAQRNIQRILAEIEEL